MNNILIAIAALIIALGGYWILTGPAPAPAPVALEQAVPAPSSDIAPATADGTTPPAPSVPADNAPASAAASASAGIAMVEVAKHATKDDCWVVILGKVYDVTAAISQHPGGEKAIINQCGKDGTQAFKNQEKHAQIGALKALAPSLKGDLAL